MKNSPQTSNLLRMFYLGFIGFIFILVIEISYIFVIFGDSVDNIKNLILHNDYYLKLDFFATIYIISEDNWIMFYILYFYLHLLLWFLLSAGLLKAINSSYTINNLQSKKLYLKMLFSFSFGLIIVLFSFGFIRFATDFLTIGWLSRLIDLLGRVLILTLFTLYWHKDGFIGDLRFYKERLSIKLRQIPGAIKALNVNKVSWFFKILFIWSIIEFFILFTLVNYFYPYLNIFGMFPEIIIYQDYLGVLMLTLPLVFSISLIFVYLAISNLQESFKNVFLKVIPVVIILCLVFVANNIRHENFLNSIDYYKKLPDETGVKLSQEIFYNTTIIFGESYEVFSVEAKSAYINNRFNKYDLIKDIRESNKNKSSGFEEFHQSLFVIQFIQCSDENINKIVKLKPYLESKNYRTSLADEYFSTLNSCYLLNWETAKYTDLQKSVFEGISLARPGLVYASPRTSWANYNKQELESFKTFLNSGDYYIGESARRNIAYKFLHYNEIEEAKKWFSETDEDLEKIDFSVKAHQGRIVGKLEINEQVKDKIRVGLFSENTPGATLEKGISMHKIKGKNLVASTNIDNEGNFVFDNLFEGSYSLAVLIKEAKIEQENIIIEKTVPIIEISSDNYDYDVGDIEIILVD